MVEKMIDKYVTAGLMKKEQAAEYKAMINRDVKTIKKSKEEADDPTREEE